MGGMLPSMARAACSRRASLSDYHDQDLAPMRLYDQLLHALKAVCKAVVVGNLHCKVTVRNELSERVRIPHIRWRARMQTTQMLWKVFMEALLA